MKALLTLLGTIYTCLALSSSRSGSRGETMPRADCWRSYKLRSGGGGSLQPMTASGRKQTSAGVILSREPPVFRWLAH